MAQYVHKYTGQEINCGQEYKLLVHVATCFPAHIFLPSPSPLVVYINYNALYFRSPISDEDLGLDQNIKKATRLQW